jgi:hypothetical protein
MSFKRMLSCCRAWRVAHIRSKDEESFKQFARIDSGFLAWDFWLKDGDDRKLTRRFHRSVKLTFQD